MMQSCEPISEILFIQSNSLKNMAYLEELLLDVAERISILLDFNLLRAALALVFFLNKLGE